MRRIRNYRISQELANRFLTKEEKSPAKGDREIDEVELYPENILAESRLDIDPLVTGPLNENADDPSARPKSTQQTRPRSRQYERINDSVLRLSQP